MYQRILVPIDGSPTSAHALQEALKLAAGNTPDAKALLRLVYVIEEIYPLDTESYAFIDYASLQEALRKTGERVLEQAAKTASQAGASVEAALLEEPGERTASVIGNDARNWKADLIVIGTHGRKGVSRMLLGSVAENVVREATVPVLLVRAGQT